MAKRIRGQLLDGLLSLTEEPVLGLDRSGAVQFLSDRFLVFYPACREGEVIWECLDSDPLVRWVSDCLNSTAPEVREQVMGHRPEALWLARLDPVMGDGGRHSGWVLRLKDIQPVERLSQRLDSFVAEVRRHLRDPLAAIKSRLEVLLEGGHHDRELTLQLLRQLNEDSNQLARLLFSLESADEPPPAPQPEGDGVPVSAVLERVCRTFEPIARAKNLALKLEVGSEVGSLSTVSESELERCLVNAVDNAVKYTALNGYGEVRVKAALVAGPEGMGVLFSVDDSGPGIPADQRQAVFDQFYRLPDGPTAQLGGTGLGLWRVQEVVLQRGGRATFEDSPLGGAGFRLVFPTAPPRP